MGWEQNIYLPDFLLLLFLRYLFHSLNKASERQLLRKGDANNKQKSKTDRWNNTYYKQCATLARLTT